MSDKVISLVCYTLHSILTCSPRDRFSSSQEVCMSFIFHDYYKFLLLVLLQAISWGLAWLIIVDNKGSLTWINIFVFNVKYNAFSFFSVDCNFVCAKPDRHLIKTRPPFYWDQTTILFTLNHHFIRTRPLFYLDQTTIFLRLDRHFSWINIFVYSLKYNVIHFFSLDCHFVCANSDCPFIQFNIKEIDKLGKVFS